MALDIVSYVKTAGDVAFTNIKKFAIPLFFGVIVISILCGFVPALKKFLMGY